jgi:DNA-binding response OmpR family regulator
MPNRYPSSTERQHPGPAPNCLRPALDDDAVVTTREHTLLLVDDDPQSRQSFLGMITISGFSVATVPTTDRALDRLRDGLEPCAILLNVSDPWSALVAFHAESAEVARIPILLVQTQSMDAARTRMLGVRDILKKPLDYELLIAAIERHCGRSHPKPSIRILLTPTPSSSTDT